MRKVAIVLIAVLLMAGVPLSPGAETIEEPAVIMPDAAQPKENESEEKNTEITNNIRKTENNYNHTVLLEDDNCKVTLSDADLSSEDGWSLTVSCENKEEEPLIFSWKNTAVTGGEEKSVWEESVTVAPAARTQLAFFSSELKEADLLQLKVTASAMEKEEAEENAGSKIKSKEEIPENEEQKTTQEEPEEAYHAEAAAIMKNANGNTYVLDDMFSPIVVDFEALTERNGDICGWLYCPDTVISYPVVQAEDNSFYLHRDIDLNYSSYGTLFTETMSEKDFNNDNSIIYGHHMKDGGMFAGLVNYAGKNYYEKHPVFYLNTPEMNYRVEVFAAFLTDMYSDAYNNTFDSDEEMQAWLDTAKDLSAIETDVEVSPGDRILTLSTCTYEYDTARYVVMGKMIPIQ